MGTIGTMPPDMVPAVTVGNVTVVLCDGYVLFNTGNPDKDISRLADDFMALPEDIQSKLRSLSADDLDSLLELAEDPRVRKVLS